MSDNLDLKNLLSEEDKRKIADEAASESEARVVATAFLVTFEKSGQVVAHADLNQALIVERGFTSDDLVAASAILAKDAAREETAARTQMMMMQAAQAAQQHMQSQQVRDRLKL